jgi:hypothetical protein
MKRIVAEAREATGDGFLRDGKINDLIFPL